MSLQQAYYTSCREGLRGTSGFQFQAVSSGIRADHLSYLERLGVYVPPPTAPTRPDDEALAAFPVSLLYARLPDGAAVVARARYVGQDYSGRYGNFFTHSLLDPDGQLEGVLPIGLWGSDLWEKEPARGTCLPEPAKPSPGRTIHADSVAAFLREPSRQAHLAAFLTAVERALSDRRRIVIVADPESVAFWVGAASLALPTRLAHELTFTTYIQNPYHTEALITGTTLDTDFRFSAPEMEHLFSVFDFLGGRFTRIESSAGARVIAAAYLEQPELVASFPTFAERLELQELGAAFLFHALSLGWSPPELDAPGLLHWCEKHGRSLRPEALQHVLRAALQGRGQQELEGLAARLGPIVPELRPTLVEWILCEVPPVRAEAALDSYPPLPDTALQRRWKARLRALETPEEILAWLRVGGRLGWLEGEGAFLRQLGESVLGPYLVSIQGAVLELGNRPLLEGLGSFLLSRVAREPGLFAALTPLLSHPGAAAILKEFALEQRATLFYFRLAAAQRGDRLAMLEECLREVQRLGELSEAHLAAALECLWNGKLPSCQEGLRLLELCGPLPQLSRVLARADLRQADPARDRLASQLGSEHVDGPVWRALETAERLRATDADRQCLEQALELDDLPEEMRGQLVEMLAERLSGCRDPAVHREILSRARSIDRFLDHYLVAVKGRLVRPAPDRAEAAAALARVWCAADLRATMEPVVRHSLEDWSKRELRTLRLELKEEPEALEWMLGPDLPGLVDRVRGWWGR